MKIIIYLFSLVVIISFVSAYGNHSTNLLHAWSFDNDNVSGGTVYDLTGRTDATNYGGTLGVFGYHGQAVDIVDDTDRVLATSNIAQYEDLTVCIWTYLDAYDGTYLFSFGPDSSNRAEITIRSGGPDLDWYQKENSNSYHADTDDGSQASKWIFFCAVRNSSHATSFLNGVQNGTQVAVSGYTSTMDDIHMGDLSRASGYAMNGKIDEVWIWNASLHPSNISDLFTGNLSYYDFDPGEAGGSPPANPDAKFTSPPTPLTGTRNNSLGDNITVSCTENGHPEIFFDQNNPPTTLIANATDSEVHWIINSSVVSATGTYYFMGNCSNSTSNSTEVRTWTYDTGGLSITLRDDNHYDNSNVSGSKYLTETLINITVSDDMDLYSFSFNRTHSNGTIIHSYVNSSLSGNKTFNYTLNISMDGYVDGTITDEICVSDPHTLGIDEERLYAFRKQKLEFESPKGVKYSIYSEDIKNYQIHKKPDRYTYNFTMVSDKKEPKAFTLRSDKPIVYLPYTAYKAHFVIADNPENPAKGGSWIDFEGNDLNPVVIKIDDYEYTILYTSLGGKLTLDSTGALNSICEHYGFTKSSLTLNEVYFNESLYGFANATEGLGALVNYEYKLFINDTQNATGSSLNANSNADTLIYNFACGMFRNRTNYTLSVRSYIGTYYTEWLNSSDFYTNASHEGWCNVTEEEEEEEEAATGSSIGNFPNVADEWMEAGNWISNNPRLALILLVGLVIILSIRTRKMKVIVRRH